MSDPVVAPVPGEYNFEDSRGYEVGFYYDDHEKTWLLSTPELGTSIEKSYAADFAATVLDKAGLDDYKVVNIKTVDEPTMSAAERLFNSFGDMSDDFLYAFLSLSISKLQANAQPTEYSAEDLELVAALFNRVGMPKSVLEDLKTDDNDGAAAQKMLNILSAAKDKNFVAKSNS